MALDNVIKLFGTPAQHLFDPLPEAVDFELEFVPVERSELPMQYVVRKDTDRALGIVGHKFRTSSHGDFFRGIQQTLSDNLPPAMLEGVEARYTHARGGAWAKMDLTFPHVKAEIVTNNGHTTEMAMRAIAWHGVDGSCSNNTLFGAIDWFCTNGMLLGSATHIKRKNSVNWNLDLFLKELDDCRSLFLRHAVVCQNMAQTRLPLEKGKDMLEQLIATERKASKMVELFNAEASVRGENVFALYSAFTNYASYADERNGFTLRNTGNDTAEITMMRREQEVVEWVNDERFTSLIQMAA